VLAAVHVADALLSELASSGGNDFDRHLAIDEAFIEGAGLTERCREWRVKAEEEAAAAAASSAAT
jgi:hypothetical protein